MQFESIGYTAHQTLLVQHVHAQQRSNADSQVTPPPTTTAQNSIPLTEDGYATLEPDGDIITTDKKPEDYILPLSENPGYDKLNDQDPVKVQSEQSTELGMENDMGSDNYDYAEPYWEPANKEEELMSQIYSTLKLQRIPAERVE